MSSLLRTPCHPFLKRWEHQITLPSSWEICIQVRKQQLEPDMEQQTDWKLGKEYIKAVYCHPDYLTSMQSNHAKCQAGWSTSWNQDCREKHQPQICRWHHPYDRKKRGTKEPLDEGERGERKSWLKTQLSKKQKSWHPVPSLHSKQMGKQWKQWQTFFSWAPESLQPWN